MLPALPTLPPAAPPTPYVATPVAEVAVPLEVGGVAAAHRATSARRRRRSPWWHTVVRAFILLAVFGGIAAAGYFFVKGVRSHSALPEFPDGVRPSYGTAVFTVEGALDGETMDVTMTADATGATWLMRGFTGGEPVDLRSDGVQVWVRSADGRLVAVPAASGDAAMHADAIGGLGRVYVFDDIVPPGSEAYFDIVGRDDVEVDGRQFDRISFVVAAQRFRDESPAVYASWFAASDEGEPTEELVGMTVDLDADGVVWRLESGDDLTGDRVVIILTSLAPEPFSVEPATGNVVGAPPEPTATTPTSVPVPAGEVTGCWDSLFCGGEMPPGEPVFPVTVPPAVQIIDSELPEPIPPSGG